MNALNGSTLSYLIDEYDRIVSIEGEWLRFARLNGAPELTPESVIGSSVWQFIDGAETTEVHRLLFDKVRSQQVALTLPFRCDAPRFRRDMEMTVSPSADHAVNVVSRVLREQERPYVPLLDAFARRSNESLNVCSWCRKVELPGKGWVEADTAIRELRLLGILPIPRVNHSMCGTCLAAVQRQIGELEQRDGNG